MAPRDELPVDRRLEELSRRRDASRLPTSRRSGAAPHDGAVVEFVGTTSFADDVEIDPGRQPDNLSRATALLVWIDRERSIGDLLPHLSGLPIGAEVDVATRSAERTPRLGWTRARALETPRCSAWLAATAANGSDVVRSGVPSSAESSPPHATRSPSASARTATKPLQVTSCTRP